LINPVASDSDVVVVSAGQPKTLETSDLDNRPESLDFIGEGEDLSSCLPLNGFLQE